MDAKVKLTIVWNNLIKPLIPRLRTGEVDIDKEPSPHLSAEAQQEHLVEVKPGVFMRSPSTLRRFRCQSDLRRRRQELQKSFFKRWLLDTKGPRPNPHWRHNNREAYNDERFG